MLLLVVVTLLTTTLTLASGQVGLLRQKVADEDGECKLEESVGNVSKMNI